jgi:acyl-CoA synthetase (AMP-forming)/AMP-acid ligase II
MLEVLTRLAQHAAEQGGRVAVRELGPGCDACLTYAQLHERVLGAAAQLGAHLPPGEVTILLTGNRVEFFVAALAVWSAGGALMPVHTSITEAELAATIARTNARLLLTDGRRARTAPGGIEQVIIETLSAPGSGRAPGADLTRSASLLLQSSGTTGLPKIAVRSSRAIDAVARNVAHATLFTPEDRVFAAIPICHSYGVENALLAPLCAGATVHLCDGLDLPTSIQQLGGPGDSHREAPAQATVFPGVPFMFEVLAGQSAGPQSTIRNPQSLRLAYSAGAPLPPQLSRAFADKYGTPIGQLYGASELGSLTFEDPSAPDADPASVGLPMDGVRVLILDPDNPDPERPLSPDEEGHVAIHAPSMLDRYLEEPAPLVGGFFLTGDLGRVSPQGRLTITGRLKHLIDIGGQKVNPAEVELTLKKHPAVAECVVVAVPVTQTVNRLKAIITPSGRVPLDEADLRAFARARLAGFKVPRVFEVRQTLPRSPTGKILRRELEAAR